MFRRIKCVLCCTVIIAAMSGCEQKEEYVEPVHIRNTFEEDSEAETSDNNREDSSEDVTISQPTDSEDVSVGESADSADSEEETKAPKLTIEEKQLIDRDGIKVTAKSIGVINEEQMEMILKVDNDRDTEISISVNTCLLNDCAMSSGSVYQNVQSGKTMNMKMLIDTSYVAGYGIEKIGDIKFEILVSDPDYNTILESDLLDVPTSLYDQMDTELIFGDAPELHDGDRLTIRGEYVDGFGTYKRKGVVLFVTNKSDRDITLSCNSLSVNGSMKEYPYFENSIILGGKKAICFCEIDEKFFQENQITNVSEIEFYLDAFDVDNYDSLGTTDTIIITR